MGAIDVVGTVTGRAASLETHADLPKHKFGSCPVCTRRLRAAQQVTPTVHRARRASTLPTRHLVQTTPVSRPLDDGQA